MDAIKSENISFNDGIASIETVEKNILNSGLRVNLPFQIKYKIAEPGISWERTVAKEAPQIPNLSQRRNIGSNTPMLKTKLEICIKP